MKKMNNIAFQKLNFFLSEIAKTLCICFLLFCGFNGYAQNGNRTLSPEVLKKIHDVDSILKIRKDSNRLHLNQAGQPAGRWEYSPGTQPVVPGNLTAINPVNPNIPLGPMGATGPEQDCANGIAVCQQSYTQSTSYTGFGTVEEVYGTCLLVQERNSVWYIFTVQNSGTFGFDLVTAHDYDYALYDLTNCGGCAGVPSATPCRCNFSATYGWTGLTADYDAANPNNPGPSTATVTEATTQSYDATMAPYEPGISDAVAGHTYALIIDNYTCDMNGYTLNFTGTAQIFNNTPPTLTSATENCSTELVTVNFSQEVQCSYIIPSNFNITGGATVTAASGTGCSTSGFTTSAVLTVSYSPDVSGTYTVSAKNIKSYCGYTITNPPTVSYYHFGAVTITPSSASVCSGSTTTPLVCGDLPSPGSITYNWTPAAGLLPNATVSNPTASPTTSTTYTVNVTWNGCTHTATVPVTVQFAPVVSLAPMNPIICSGTADLTATSTVDGSACTDCSYSWASTTAPPTYSQSSVASSTWAARPAGTYTVTVTSDAGCSSTNSVVTSTISIASSPPAATCNIYYATPTGSGTGLTPTSPTNLTAAVAAALCNGSTIELSTGTYTLNNPLSIYSDMTIEGGYNYDGTAAGSFTQKTSLAGSTTITRNTSNVEGYPDAARLVAIEATSSTNFRLQDLTITTSPAPAANGTYPKGVSTYGIYLSSCSNYYIVRCQITSGNASAGYTGTAGTAGIAGNPGGTGCNGGNGCYPECGGAEGGGAGSSHTSSQWSGGCGSANATYPQAEAANGGYRSGGEGGMGGTGSYNNNSAGGYGSQGGNGGGGAVGGGGSSGSPGGCTCSNAGSGSPGNAGANGGAGAAGSAGSCVSGFWATGGQGVSGGDGAGGAGGGGGGGAGGENSSFIICSKGTGGGGGAGGGGGQGGSGGTGGWGGGSSYCIFLNSNSTNGNVIDCQLTVGALGGGGTGGSSSSGGGGGSGGSGGNGNGGEECNGGNGGNGGSGGSGGAGGNGSAGEAVTVKTNGGTALATNTTLALSSQPTIYAGDATNYYTNCIGSSMNMWIASGTITWTFNSAPADGTNSGGGTTRTTTYPTTGRKKVIMNNGTAYTYTDFNNILTSAPSAGIITATACKVCAGGTINFQSSVASTPGYSGYSWTAPAVSGNTPIITSPTSSSTNITFPNNTAGNLTFNVYLVVKSQCCGNLGQISYVVTVYPAPTVSASNSAAPCIGGTSTLTASGSSGTYNWYSGIPPTGPLGTGSTYIVSPEPASTTYYIQVTDGNGCTNTNSVVVAGTVNNPPNPNSFTVCQPGNIILNVPAVAGATIYNWYGTSCGVGLLQSGPSRFYTYYVTAGPATQYLYVTVQTTGCAASTSCATVTITYTTPSSSLSWVGGTSTDWYDPANWSGGGCYIPTCLTNVTIPVVGTNYPTINMASSHNPSSNNAACNSITLASGAQLNFLAAGMLDVCGDFINNGATISSTTGTINFIGTVAQNFYNNSSGAFNLFNVVLNNSLGLTIRNKYLTSTTQRYDLNISTTGSFVLENGILTCEGDRTLVINNTDPTSLSGNSSAYYASSYVNGRVKRAIGTSGCYDFPVGTAKSSQLINLNITSNSTGSLYLTAFFDNPLITSNLNGFTVVDHPYQWTTPMKNGGASSGADASNPGIWTVLSSVVNPVVSYNVTLYGTNFLTYSNPVSPIKRSGWCTASNLWNWEGAWSSGSATATLASGVRNGLYSFSQFSLAVGTTYLPIELLSFSLNCKDNNIVVSWVTAAELNNSFFTIERSCDGINYNTLGTVPGAGTSNTVLSYSFTDNNFPGGPCYYRLSQTDYNGTTVIAATDVTNCKNTGQQPLEIVSVFPNPANNELYIVYNATEDNEFYFSLWNTIGQQVEENKYRVQMGTHAITLYLDNLNLGMYLLNIKDKDKNNILTKKICKQ